MLEGKQIGDHLGVYTEKDIKETFDIPFREHNSILSFCCCGELLSADIKEYRYIYTVFHFCLYIFMYRLLHQL
jgi:hypothetical protein